MSWRKLLYLTAFVVVLVVAGSRSGVCRADWPDNVGLLFGSQGIEPGDPSQGEAPPGKTNWYVDADAPDGGNGSYANPYNSFEQVVGYLDGSTYHQGQIQGGDYLYLKGTFSASDHVAGSNNMDILIYRASQAGTASEPTVIKSWLGSPRAVFDCEYIKNDVIHLSSNTGPGGHFVIQNIEVKRAKDRGIRISSNVAGAEVISVVIRDGYGNGDMGVGGAILFCLFNNQTHYIMRNSLIYNNDINPTGVPWNRAGISILSEPSGQLGASIDVYDNEIYNESYGVRHKHSGEVTTRVYHNIIHDGGGGVVVRATNGSYVHHNIMYNLSREGMLKVNDGQGADTYEEFYNNTLYNVGRLVGIGGGQPPNNYRRDFNIHDNIYYDNVEASDWVIELGRWSGSEYPIEQWESSYNTYYYLPSRTTFLFAVPNAYTFEEAEIYLSDSTMFTFDPEFVDAANYDFHLQPTSPAIGAGSTGGDLGALGTGSPQPPGQASNPSPADSATGVSIDADLSWTAGSGSTSSDVYFGTDSTPDAGEFQGNQTATTYEPGTMANNTTYYWRIDEINAQGTTAGNVWNFTTEAAPTPPGQASNPNPADSAADVSITADLSWTGGSGATSSDVYFGTSSPGTFQGNQTATTYDTGTMANDTTYYWRIDEVNAAGTTTGIAWSFTTEIAGGPDAFLQDSGADGIVSMEAENYDVYTQQGSHDWISVTTPSGYTGTAAMNTTPNNGTNQNTGYASNSPRLDFQVNFVKTGTHYVWIRGYGASGSDDSIHAGLDGAEISTCDRISTFSTSYTWSKATMDGPDATFNVASTGVHTVNAWMREDGFVFDKIVLTTNAGYTPTGSGPAESPRGGGGNPPGQASNPGPADSATDVSITADLSWTAGSDTTSHDVYFGTSSPGTFQGNQTAATFDTGTMANDTTYYWRIDEVNAEGTTTGNVWSFTTIIAAPGQASNPSPADSATDVSNTAILSWTAGSSATSRDVYFGTSSPGDFQGNQTDTTFDPGTLSYDITYYWRIDEINAVGTTTGNVWSFTTEADPSPPSQATNPDPADSATDVSVETDLSWTAGTGSTSSDVYFGTTSPGAFQGNQTATTFETGTMDYDTTYYWRIDEVNTNGTTTGNVWNFTTIVAGAPVTVEFGDAVDTNYPGTIEDTYTNVGQAAVNFSTIVTLNTYTWPADTVANTTIIKWDLSAIPTDATVTEATLYLYQIVTGGDTSYDIGVHKIINVNPVVSALTWNTYDGTNSWTGGADGGQADTAAAEDTPAVNSTNNEYKTWSVTNMVADWVSTPASNYGMLVNSDPVASVDSYRTFASTDDSDTSIRPKLIVTYSTGAAPPGQASNPSPDDSAADVSVTADLSWTAGGGSTSSDVYFGTASPGTFQSNQAATTFDPGTMANDTTYYWRIDEVNTEGTTTGNVWSFTTIVAAPGQASSPSPADSAANVSINEDLSWTAGSGATSHDVYFGTSSPGTFQGNQAATTFDTGTMANDTTYYWRIDEVNAAGTTTGTVWSFTTIVTAPGSAISPSPGNGATDVVVNADLSWTAGSGATSHDVYFGTSSPGSYQGNQTDATFDTGTMANDTTYYWRIDEANAAGTTTGTVWSFTTIVTAPGSASSPSPGNGATDVVVNADLSWTAGSGAASHDVYFGTSSPGTFQGNQTATTFDPGTMANDTTYYWRIDETNAGGTTTGTVWNFTTIVAAPGQSSSPSPANTAADVDINANLSWSAGSGATSHDVYFGTSSPGSYQGNQTATTFDPGTMANDTTYYWRIDEVNAGGTTTGSVWSFTTEAAAVPPPGQASNPSPTNSAANVAVNTDLSWTAGSDTTSHDVYFGTSSPGSFQGNQAAATFDTGTMANDTTYYWRIDEVGLGGTTTGNVWNFTTIVAAPGQASNPGPGNGATDVSINADLSWSAGSGATSHDVYFGTSSPGAFQGNQTATTFDTGTMANDTTYYWRIDEVNAAGTTAGSIWSFTTIVAAPAQASSPSPSNSATDVSVSADLSWTAGSGATSHDVYFGTSSPGTFQGNQTATTFDTGTMANDTTYYWRIDEVNAAGTTTGSVWSFTTIVSSGDQIIGWWELDEGSGGTAADSSTYGNDGTLLGNVAWTDDAEQGWCLDFPGNTTDHVTIPNESDYDLTGNMTVMAWMKAGYIDWRNFSTIIAKGQDPTGWALQKAGRDNAMGFYVGVSGMPWDGIKAGVGIFDNQWHHVAGVYDGSNAYIYIDGGLDSNSVPCSGSITTNDYDVYMGLNSQSMGRSWEGLVDDIRVYNYALTQSQINDIYSGGPTPPGQASSPSPADSATDVDINADLSWTAGSGATSRDVYFGTSSPGTFQGNQTATTFDAGTMSNDTTYYWRIDEVNAEGTTTGVVWSFTTIVAAPSQATNPSPTDSAVDVSVDADLSWTAGSGATSRDVYFGTTSPGTFQANQTATTFDPGTMSNDTTYYWRIDEINAGGTTTGNVWNFTTEAAAEPVTEEFGDATNTDHPGTVQDTYTNVGEGGSVNYSTDVTLNTYTWPKDTVANTTIIKWDLSSIPTSATVTDATLYLYQVETGGDASYDIGVHKIINLNPVISACTWNTYDGTNSWTGGADGGQNDIAAAEDTQIVDNTNNLYKTWSVTNMVQDWVSTPSGNYGMLVNSDSVAKKDSYRSFTSTQVVDSSTRPKLIVTYSD